jgi:isopropylmalate/homocitrate/citramalate synthase
MRPESVGAPPTKLVLGRHSGLRGLDARCRALGHGLRVEDLRRLYARMLEATDHTKSVDDVELEALVRGLGPAPGAGFGAIGAVHRDATDEDATRHAAW